MTWKSIARVAGTFQKQLLCDFQKLTCPSCWCCADTLLSPENKLGVGDGLVKALWDVASAPPSLSEYMCSVSVRQSAAHLLQVKSSSNTVTNPPESRDVGFRNLWKVSSLIGSACFAVKVHPSYFYNLWKKQIKRCRRPKLCRQRGCIQ